MSYTNETAHYGIPLPLGSDLTTPMDYNTCAEAIDTDLFTAKGTAQTANTNANSALDAVENITNNVIGGANGIDARLTAVEGTQTTQGTAITNLTNTVGDNKQDLMDSICSIAEASATATTQHLVGTYFWYNDTLYKTTVQINVGDTIVPNTNCQTTNVTTEILGIDVSGIESDVAQLQTDVSTLETNSVPVPNYTSRTTVYEKVSTVVEENVTIANDGYYRLVVNCGDAGDFASFDDYESNALLNISGVGNKALIVPFKSGTIIKAKTTGISPSLYIFKCN